MNYRLLFGIIPWLLVTPALISIENTDIVIRRETLAVGQPLFISDKLTCVSYKPIQLVYYKSGIRLAWLTSPLECNAGQK